ncbi:Mg-dependent DNase, tatD family [Alteracholeplasma palmae J233]|uniref:Mg-dependent DNase, tatD family n=1 Tax=Alteracholeplasma palmae (strain ATCC 49389 / J233) TaxID=1318466 RepID=U4KLQ4_ALTPJ|nr:TatD family hydrolase [Alteracholeplasma palmae]CCV64837.1 Mg-dependent DNase, tatD family [Alteracholeplasma palmae J233]
MIIDTHAHLNIEEFSLDLETVLNNAKRNNISKIIVIGMNDETNAKAVELAEKYEELYAAVGIHPSYIENESYETITKYLKHPKVVSVGEIGTDLYWVKDNIEKQKEYFKAQIEIAIKYNKPIIIHTRESFHEAYEVLLPYKGQIRGVFHCLTSSLEDAKKALELGFYIGIGGVLTFKKAINVHEIAVNIPLDKILLETDAPYLAPVPYRGKRNEPAYTRMVAIKLAELRNISVEEVESVTTQNAIKLFSL